MKYKTLSTRFDLQRLLTEFRIEHFEKINLDETIDKILIILQDHFRGKGKKIKYEFDKLLNEKFRGGQCND